jgi:uncharacterized protein YqhQ
VRLNVQNEAIGGRAHDNGVTFSGLRYKVTATRECDDRIVIEETENPPTPLWIENGEVFLYLGA